MSGGKSSLLTLKTFASKVKFLLYVMSSLSFVPVAIGSLIFSDLKVLTNDAHLSSFGSPFVVLTKEGKSIIIIGNRGSLKLFISELRVGCPQVEYGDILKRAEQMRDDCEFVASRPLCW